MKIVLFATAWGPKHGGINAFNRDFAAGLAEVLGVSYSVTCVVLADDAADRKEAQTLGVKLVSIDQKGGVFDPKWISIVEDAFTKHCIDYTNTCWVGHDVISGAIAMEAEKRLGGQSALIHHMALREYQSQKYSDSASADVKVMLQRQLFQIASGSTLFAVGPLLKASCDQLTGRDCIQLVPGFPPEAGENTSRDDVLEALTFGRMDRADDRIKQGRLAVASFGKAVRLAKEQHDNPQSLANNPEITILGLSMENESEEDELRKLVNEFANRDVRFFGLAFEDDRRKTFERLARANVALMLSLHEGFGLTGWEAIAFEVPLILSQQSGLCRLISDTLGGAGLGCVIKLDIRGARNDSERFHPDDLEDVSSAYLKIAGRLLDRKRDAKTLKQLLIKQMGCTWGHTATTFLRALKHVPTNGSDDCGVEPSSSTSPPTVGILTKISVPIVTRMSSLPAGRQDEFLNLDQTSSFRRGLALRGFQDLRFPTAVARGFQRYLDDDNLPYFSRDEYATQVGAVGQILSERAILQKIDVADGPVTILIDGPGGFGKTRLARRICLECGAELALPVDQNSDYPLLRELLSVQHEVRHLALFLDYAENVRTAGALRFFCEDLNETLGIRTTLVLCSRSSGSDSVQYLFRDFAILRYSLGIHSADSAVGYEHWLVDRILNYLGLDENVALANMCRSLPFMAAFAGYTKTYHPQAFDRQFGITLDSADFARWVGARIAVLNRFGVTTKRRMAEIALSLPMAAEEMATILRDPNDTGEHVFQALNDDLWVEHVGDQIVSLHDTLADALVATHLFGTAKPSGRLVEILSTAADKSYLGCALRVVNRIAGHDRFQDINAQEVLLRVEARHADATRQNALDILRSALVPMDRVPQMIETVFSLYEGIYGNSNAHAFLAETAAYVAQRRSPGAIDAARCRFDALLSQVKETSDPQIFANLLAYDSVTFATAGQRLIAHTANQRDASYLIEAYLRNVGDFASIGSYVVTWLGRYGRMPRAGFVLAAWFGTQKKQARPGVPMRVTQALNEQVLEYLHNWCVRFCNEYYAATCLQTLVEICGYREDVLDLIDSWLEKHVETYRAVHLLRVLLQARPASDKRLSSFASQWLGRPADQRPILECSYLFRDLRYYKYEFCRFEADLWSLIVDNGPTKNRRDLCICWLQWGGDPIKVRDILRGLIAEDPLDEHVRFAFESWFNAAPEDVAFFRKEMQAWLVANAKHPRASYTFNVWFGSGLDPKPIMQPLIDWLNSNREDISFPFLIGRFTALDPSLMAAVGLTSVHATALLQREVFQPQDCRDIEFILRAPYCRDRTTEIAQKAIEGARRYLDQHVDLLTSAFLIAEVISVTGAEDWIISHAERWLDSFLIRHRASLVLQAVLVGNRRPQHWEARVAQWLMVNRTYSFSGQVLLAWCKAGGNPDRFRSEALAWLSAASESENDEYFEIEAVAECFGLPLPR